MNPVAYLEQMWQLAAEGQTQGIWFWAALYGFAVCLYSLLFQLRTRYWPCTSGQLMELGMRKFGATEITASEQDYVSKALYRYRVGEKDYEGKRISPWIFVASHNARFLLRRQMSAIQRYPDGGVRVFYNPRKPEKSYLVVAGWGGILVTLAICLLAPVSYYLRYYG